MKKFSLTKTLLTLSLALLVGCGNNSTTTSQENGSSENKESAKEDSKQVTLTYGIWDIQQEPAMKALATKFTEQNPNIKIDIKVTPWKEYWTSLETSVSANAAPDVFWMNIPRSIDYISNDILLPLDDIGISKSDYPETHISAYSTDGKLYGVPKDFDDIALVYNKTLFDEAGVSYPNENWTWDDFKDAATKLTNKETGVSGCNAPPYWQEYYYNLIYQNGSSPFTEEGKSNFNDPKVIESLEFLYSLVQDGYSPDLATLQNSEGSKLMLSGKLAMLFDGSWNVELFESDEYGKANVDYAVLPKKANHATVSNALANVVYSKGKNIDAAKKFVAFLSSKESNEYIAKESTVIPAFNGTQTDWIARYPGKNVSVFVDSVKDAVHLPTIPNFNAADNIANDYLVKAWSGEISIKDACEKITVEQDAVLPGFAK